MHEMFDALNGAAPEQVPEILAEHGIALVERV